MKERKVLGLLNEKWSVPINDYWIPLSSSPILPDIIYFNYDEFENEFGIKKLQNLVKENFSSELLETNEECEEFNIPIEDLAYMNGCEAYHTNKNLDWVMYMSHENTITFKGEKLIALIKSNWSDWENWKNPWS